MLYASRTGTKRNLAAMREAGIRLLCSPTPRSARRTEGMEYGLDNGKWRSFSLGEAWSESAFLETVDTLGAGADFLVVPDIVAGGLASLDLSASWLPRLSGACPLLLIAAQDGMAPADVAPLLGPGVGLFMGGSTAWKLRNMIAWGRFAARRGVYYHVGRVNTAKRIALAIAAGAHSSDGSSASRFAKTVPLLAGAARQPDFLAPKVAA